MGGQMATMQAFIQAIFGPFWGVMCARGYMQRKTILATMTFAQGLATFVMCFFVNSWFAMMALRALNGACLAGLLPVANSIVADRFDDSIRGRMFALMNMSRGLGGTLFGALYSITSEWCPSGGRWESCALPVENDCTVDTPPCICENGFFGWEYSFIVTGVVVMAFAPVIYLVMNPPPVTVKNVGVAGENIVLSELKALAALLCNTPTFLILVVQGCFGGMPWSALQFRGFFFETAGPSPKSGRSLLPGRLRWRDPSPHSGHSFSLRSTTISATMRLATTHALPHQLAPLTPIQTGMQLGKPSCSPRAFLG